MKTSTVLILAGAGVAILFILTRSKANALKAPNTSTTNLLAAAGGGVAVGGIISKLFGSGSSSSGTSVASSGSSYIPDTATSNYLADATAAADDTSGVVGFGGWD